MVVSNSSPLINMARIGRFELLRQMFGEIIIPVAVYEEVVGRGRNRDGSLDVRDASWISTASPADSLAVSSLTSQLDLGEASAIIVAQEHVADLLLIDEIRGRRVAAKLGVKVLGTLGILARAKREGLIPNLADELTRLQSTGTWMSPALRREILELAGESQ